MSGTTTIFFLLGLVALVAGAEVLVRGAARLAGAARISPLVVGLTVVAWGTSAPEVAVSLQAAVGGQPDVALGNVVGSNIANVLLVLGLCAAFTPLVVAQQLVWLEVPLLIGVSILLVGCSLDGAIGRLDALALVLGAAGYAAFAMWQSRREQQVVREEYAEEIHVAGSGPVPMTLRLVLTQGGLVAGGLGLLVLGAGWLVDTAVAVAGAFGLSALVIGLTVVAVGTSLPEIATSVIAGLRGQRDIAVGNAIGSCLFNLLGVLGLAGLASPAELSVAPAALRFDMPVMVATAAACLPIFFTGHLIARWEGAVFLAYYAAYLTYLVLDATGHDALPPFSIAMLAFVMPLTTVTLGVLTVREVRSRAKSA